ncbi:MAG: rod shape-determining protein MreC [Terriglobia bacterium]
MLRSPVWCASQGSTHGSFPKATMQDLNPAEIRSPSAPRTREAPEIMQAFMARHVPFFVLFTALIAQFLLLSFQITRNHNVRLIEFWAVSVFDPFERSALGLTDAAFGAADRFQNLWSAQQKNKQLQAELASAHAEIQELSERASENARLRKLLNFKEQLPYEMVAAEVIAASPGVNSSAVFIDKGADSGLTTDLPVITPEGVVGKTIAVFSRTSQVLLITDAASGVGSMLAGSRIQGVLQGGERNLCTLDFVMNEENVSPGIPVLTSGLDRIYPKGLLLGRVVSVGNGNIYKRVDVRPAAAMDHIEDVLVILKSSITEQAQGLPAHP